MLRNRKGVTLIEIMTVVFMATIMMAVAFPHLKDTRRAASMQSARVKVESYLALARAVAIRNGGRTRVVQNGNKLTIQADTGSGWFAVGQPLRFDDASNVKLDATVSEIVYDARGLATGLDAGGERFYLTPRSGFGAGTKDSVCVTRLGLVLDRNCGLAVAADKKEDAPPVDEGGGIDIDPIITPITDPIVQ